MKSTEMLNGRARRELYPAALLLALLGSWAATADSPAVTAGSPLFRQEPDYFGARFQPDQGVNGSPTVASLACRDFLRTPAVAWCEPALPPRPGAEPAAREEGGSL